MQAENYCAVEIEKNLSRPRKGKITVLETVDSTNTYLKSLCRDGLAKRGDCIIADSQTGGRGRRGKSFMSKGKVGIYMSVLLSTGSAAPEQISEITAWGAVAVHRAINRICNADCKIKWVNDLVCGNLKICGILTEMTKAGPVMGIGINVNGRQGDFPEELSGIATTLEEVCKKSFDRCEIIAAVLEELDILCENFPNGKDEYLSEYTENCAVIGKDIMIEREDEIKRGRAVGIDRNFGLRVIFSDGTKETVTGGDVSVKGFYKK